MPKDMVYVVDDDDAVRAGLARLLDALGYSVHTFADGGGFLVGVDPERTGCALVDACLTGTTGLDVVSDLRNRRIDVPVIFISGCPDIATCVRAMKEGAVDFLQKPLRTEELLPAIQCAHLMSINRQHAREASRRSQELLARLTLRELQVLALVLEGRRNKEIAARLDSQEATVKVHRSRLMRKLGVRSVPDLVRIGGSVDLARLVENSETGSEACESARARRKRGHPALLGPDARDAWLAATGPWTGFTWGATGTRGPRS